MRPELLFLLSVLAAGYSFSTLLCADTLGRLFTSDYERKRLDYIRKQKPAAIKRATMPEEVDNITEPKAGKEIAIIDTINIKGLVKRDDGKNSVWINDSNIYADNMSIPYIKIRPGAISTDGVTIQIPDNEMEVEIKVGETFNPNNGQVSGIGNRWRSTE